MPGARPPPPSKRNLRQGIEHARKGVSRYLSTEFPRVHGGNYFNQSKMPNKLSHTFRDAFPCAVARRFEDELPRNAVKRPEPIRRGVLHEYGHPVFFANCSCFIHAVPARCQHWPLRSENVPPEKSRREREGLLRLRRLRPSRRCGRTKPPRQEIIEIDTGRVYHATNI